MKLECFSIMIHGPARFRIGSDTREYILDTGSSIYKVPPGGEFVEVVNLSDKPLTVFVDGIATEIARGA